MGLDGFIHPIFCNCSFGIRFQIGVGSIYGKDGAPRNEYIENALHRAMTIYNRGMKCPSILVWEVFTQSDNETHRLKSLFQNRVAPIYPQEESVEIAKIDGEQFKQSQFYWSLNESHIPMDTLFKEIILGNLRGLNDFVSSVYLFDVENHVMIHLYDDRGLDIVSHEKNTLMPLYQELNGWILDYDRKRIEEMLLG